MGQSESGVGGLTAVLITIVAIVTMLFILALFTNGGDFENIWPFTDGAFITTLPVLVTLF